MSNRLRHARSAFKLYAATTGFLHHSRCISKSNFRTFFVAAERHIDDDESPLRAAHDSFGVQDHQIERHAKCRLHAMDDHPKRVADQHDIDIVIEKLRSMGVIAGEADDGLVYLSGIDLRYMSPLNVST